MKSTMKKKAPYQKPYEARRELFEYIEVYYSNRRLHSGLGYQTPCQFETSRAAPWIVERTFAWVGRNRRLSKDYEFKVQTSEAFIDLAAIRLMLKRLAPR